MEKSNCGTFEGLTTRRKLGSVTTNTVWLASMCTPQHAFLRSTSSCHTITLRRVYQYFRSSAITPTRWKTQRVSVLPTDKGDTPLSTFDLVTGLHAYPIRPLPSPSIPRSSSLVFHPTQMLYGVGLPDGSIRVMGCKLEQPSF
jgi:hypothetical protein